MNDAANKPSRPDHRLTTEDKLRLLLDITNKISQSLDLDEVLNLVMDTLGSLLPYDAAGIYLIDLNPDSHDPYIFKSKVIRGYDIGFQLKEPRLRMGEGFIGGVAQTGRPIICGDVGQDSRYFEARARTRSEMAAPIISNERVIGVFDLESDSLDAYEDDDLAVLEPPAGQEGHAQGRQPCRVKVVSDGGRGPHQRSRRDQAHISPAEPLLPGRGGALRGWEWRKSVTEPLSAALLSGGIRRPNRELPDPGCPSGPRRPGDGGIDVPLPPAAPRHVPPRPRPGPGAAGRQAAWAPPRPRRPAPPPAGRGRAGAAIRQSAAPAQDPPVGGLPVRRRLPCSG